MPNCKHCNCEKTVKDGKVRGSQRYKCKGCGRTFVVGDKRLKPENEAKKALAIILYSMAKGSFRMIAKIFGVSHTLIYRWIRKFGESLPEPELDSGIQEMEFDEMWHFIGSKKQTLSH
jgi:transposase